MLSMLDILALLQLVNPPPKYGSYIGTLCLDYIYHGQFRYTRGVYKNIPIGAYGGDIYFVAFYGQIDDNTDGDSFKGAWCADIQIIRFTDIIDKEISTQLLELFEGDLETEKGVCVSSKEEFMDIIRKEQELNAVVAINADSKLNSRYY